MAASVAAYTAALQGLLPPGRAWSRDPDANLTKLLGFFADGLAAVDERGDDLVEEADPRTTIELLGDWERIAGLPDPCAGGNPGLATRQAILVARLTARGGQSIAYLTGVAAALGYPIAIEEFRPMSCSSTCDATLYTDPYRFAFRVHAAKVTVTGMTCNSGCDENLQSWGNAVLECTIRSLAPAHTFPTFAYDGET